MEQTLANGIISGLVLGVLAMSFAVVYVPTRIFHVAMAAVYALVPYVAWSLGPFGAIPATIAAIGMSIAASAACERLNHRTLVRRDASTGAHLISSLGIYVVAVQVIALVWGDETRMLRAGLQESLIVGDLRFGVTQVIASVVSLTTLVAFFAWLGLRDSGLRLRAMAQSIEEFSLRGHDPDRARALAFAVSGLLCGVGSLLVAYDVGFDPHSGLDAVLPAMIAVMLGGPHRFLAAMLIALGVGAAREFATWLFSSNWADTLIYASLVGGLVARTAYGRLAP